MDLKNHYDKPVNIFTYDGRGQFFKLTQIKPDETYYVPLYAVYSEPYEFYFQIEEPGAQMSYESFKWRELIQNPTYSKPIQCSNTDGGIGAIIHIQGTVQEIFLKDAKDGKMQGKILSS